MTWCPHCRKPIKVSLAKPNGQGKPRQTIITELKPFINDLDIKETNGAFVIRTLRKLTKPTFRSICKIVEAHGGKWIPEPENWRWEAPA